MWDAVEHLDKAEVQVVTRAFMKLAWHCCTGPIVRASRSSYAKCDLDAFRIFGQKLSLNQRKHLSRIAEKLQCFKTQKEVPVFLPLFMGSLVS